MPSRVDISVVVCTFNRAGMLERSVESLFALVTEHAYAFEIVVVDDGSTDCTPETLNRLAAGSPVAMRCVQGEGRGVAAARNAGIHAAAGDAIAFFDDDQTADSRWLIELWHTLQMSGAACVGGSRSLELDPDVRSGIHPIIRRYLGEIEDEGPARPCRRNDLLCTGTVLIARAAIVQVGLFNEKMTQGGEDTEYFTRVRAAGLENWMNPASKVCHMVPNYRLDRPYLGWSAIRGGECFAWRDITEYGRPASMALGVARLVHATLVHLPRLVWAHLRKRPGGALPRMCQWIRAVSYAWTVFRPRGNGARRPGDAEPVINFRNERKLFSNSQS